MKVNHNAEAVYASGALFHGPDLHAITRVTGLSSEGIEALVGCAPQPSVWQAEPARSSWLADPLAIDAALQLVIYWCVQEVGEPCLPSSIASYRQYVRSWPREGVCVSCRVARRNAQTLDADIDWVDAQGQLIARAHGCTFTIQALLSQAFARNQLPVRVEA